MFSTRNPALTSYSDGLFTRFSSSTNHTRGDYQGDLISFLSIVQKCNVDILPITWQPALGTLGQGGSGTISQSALSPDMSLAFKRFHHSDSGDSDQDLLPLVSEVLILSQPSIQNHPNIVDLEGICWEIQRRTEKAVPVLVFEKAAWDLQQFMNISEGMNMSIDDRLNVCADLGSAITALHAYGVLLQNGFLCFGSLSSNKGTDIIHGDIKPQNVLVFKDCTGKTTVKMTDFGYSTLATGENGCVFLPKSRPWNAPEHHWGEFKVPDAKKTDVYSFGLLCLWVLFGSVPRPQNTTEHMFDASTECYTSLEQLKKDDKVKHIAYGLMESVQLAGLNAEHRIRLEEFFRLTVSLEPGERTSDFEKLICLLSKEK